MMLRSRRYGLTGALQYSAAHRGARIIDIIDDTLINNKKLVRKTLPPAAPQLGVSTALSRLGVGRGKPNPDARIAISFPSRANGAAATLRPPLAVHRWKLLPKRSMGALGLDQARATMRVASQHDSTPPPPSSNASATVTAQSIVSCLETAMQRSNVIGVSGCTGSGKSSLIPLGLAEILAASAVDTAAPPPLVWVTQPTRVACRAVARHAAALVGSEGLGEVVGVALPDGEVHVGPRTRIIFSTPGYVARYLGHASSATDAGVRSDNNTTASGASRYRFDALVIDEIHIGDVDALALLVVARTILLPAASKIVLMSATVTDAQFQRLAEYLLASAHPSASSGPCTRIPLVDLGSHRHRLERWYLDRLPSSLTCNMPAELLNLVQVAAGPHFLTAALSQTRRSARTHEQLLARFALHLSTFPPSVSTPDDDRTLPASVLVFVPGYGEMRAVLQCLAKLSAKCEWHSSADIVEALDQGTTPTPLSDAAVSESEGTSCDFATLQTKDGCILDVLLLHATVFGASQKAAMRRLLEHLQSEQRVSHSSGAAADAGSSARRRIYIATNVAESSITLPDVRCVLDSGLQRRPEASTVAAGGRMLFCTELCSPSSTLQRCGRAGRTFPGVAFHMYSTEAYRVAREKRDTDADAETQVEALLRRLMLLLLTLPRVREATQGSLMIADVVPPLSEEFIGDRWPAAAVSRMSTDAVEYLLLRRWAARSPASSVPPQRLSDLIPTFIGHVMAQLSLPQDLSNFVALAAALGCATDAIAAVAGLTVSGNASRRTTGASGAAKLVSHESAKMALSGGVVSDIWLARNATRIALLCPRKPTGFFSFNGGMWNRLREMIHALHITVDIANEVADTVTRLCDQLGRVLRDIGAGWDTDIAALNQLSFVASYRQDSHSKPAFIAAVRRLFPASTAGLCEKRLLAAYVAAFGRHVAIGQPLVRQETAVRDAHASSPVPSAFCAPIVSPPGASSHEVQTYGRAVADLLGRIVAADMGRNVIAHSASGFVCLTLPALSPTSTRALKQSYATPTVAPAAIRALNCMITSGLFSMVTHRFDEDFAPPPSISAPLPQASASDDDTTEGGAKDHLIADDTLRGTCSVEEATRVVEALNGSTALRQALTKSTSFAEHRAVSGMLQKAARLGWVDDVSVFSERLQELEAASEESSLTTTADSSTELTPPTPPEDDDPTLSAIDVVENEASAEAVTDGHTVVYSLGLLSPTLRYAFTRSTYGTEPPPQDEADDAPNGDDCGSTPREERPVLCVACGMFVYPSEHKTLDSHKAAVARLIKANIPRAELADAVASLIGGTDVFGEMPSTKLNIPVPRRTRAVFRPASLLCSVLPPLDEDHLRSWEATAIPGRALAYAVSMPHDGKGITGTGWLVHDGDPAFDLGMICVGAFEPIAAPTLVLSNAARTAVRALRQGLGPVHRIGVNRDDGTGSYASYVRTVTSWCLNPAQESSARTFRHAAMRMMLPAFDVAVPSNRVDDAPLSWMPLHWLAWSDAAAAALWEQVEARGVASAASPTLKLTEAALLQHISKIRSHHRQALINWGELSFRLASEVAKDVARNGGMPAVAANDTLIRALDCSRSLAFNLGSMLIHRLGEHLGYASAQDLLTRGLGIERLSGADALLPGAVPTLRIPSLRELTFLLELTSRPDANADTLSPENP